ncbi:MAG: head GIN domain-containing protein [Pseudomonadota bacterium]
MKSFLTLLAALGSLLIGGTAAAGAEKRYDLDGFDSISVATGIKAVVTVGGDYSIIAESSEKGLDRLEVRVSGGELKLRRRNRGWQWGRSENVKVSISMPDLTMIDASSGAYVSATGIDAADMVVEASSGSRIKASGDCGELSADVSSGAQVDIGALVCENVVAEASSGASVKVYAEESIDADASSGAKISVRGSPNEVRKDSSSGGRVVFN